MITKLESITRLNPSVRGDENKPKYVYNPGDNLFEDIFRSAIQNVKETSDEKAKNQYLLATGQLDNPSSLMIAASKYSTSVNLLAQLRNKALEAYNELNRMGG